MSDILPPPPLVSEGDIVQVIHPKHTWYPCLVVVSEVKSSGIRGYLVPPANPNPIFMDMDSSNFVKVGRARLVAKHVYKEIDG